MQCTWWYIDTIKFANETLRCFVRRSLERLESCELWSFIITLNRDGVGLSSSVRRPRSVFRTAFSWPPVRWWPPPPVATAGRRRANHLNVSWSNLCPTSRRLPWIRPSWPTTDPSTCRRPSITQRPSPVPLQVSSFRSETRPSSLQYAVYKSQ